MPENKENSNYRRLLLIKQKKDDLLNIKLREEELKNADNLIPIKLRVIDSFDILGLEEALELKRRYYTIKCVSAQGELYKINLNVRICI